MVQALHQVNEMERQREEREAHAAMAQTAKAHTKKNAVAGSEQ
jgi:hypothetical protein